MNTRRTFLRDAAGALTFLPAAAATLAEFRTTLAAQPADGEAYWQHIRDQFPFADAKVPMNAANLCPAPRAVLEKVVRWSRDIDTDCSFDNRDKYKEMLETSRKKVAAQLHVTPDEIALVRNTSEANNVINGGLNLSPGDEVILWDQNHPTNNVAWNVRAKRYGLRIRRVATPANPEAVSQLVDAFASAFTNKTRVLSITHVSNVSGVRLPVRELAEAAHAQDIYVHVDGAQTWGAFDVNLRELGCDSYTASAHKWFCGPKEVGLLYVREDRVGSVWPHIVAPGWGNDVEPDVQGARKFESLGQRDDAALSALADAADFHAEIGPARVERRVRQLAQTLKEKVRRADFELVTPIDPQFSGGVCIVKVPSAGGGRAAERMYAEFGIAGAATGGLRLCPHVYNTAEHIERAVRGIRAVLG